DTIQPSSNDNYFDGVAYLDSGSGWNPLSNTVAAADLNFNTLVKNTALTYVARGGQTRSVVLTTGQWNGKVLLIEPDSSQNPGTERADIFDPVTVTIVRAPAVTPAQPVTQRF